MTDRRERVTRNLPALLLLLLLGAGGCSFGGLLDSDELPPDVSDPVVTQTPAGARAAYYETVAHFRAIFSGFPPSSGSTQVSFVAVTGVITDELSTSGSADDIDRRASKPNTGTQTYAGLQKVRGQAAQAIGLLTDYAADQPAFAGHLYALQGYSEIFLAELFCSGIPLSTLDYNGDYTYKPGSLTEEVLAHAVTLFDTALTLVSDSVELVHLAHIGRARALLALGRHADAATEVAAVPDGFRYEVKYTATATPGSQINWYSFARTNVVQNNPEWYFTVPDQEGTNGMDWRTSGDPRTQVTPRGAAYHPNKYAPDGSSPIVLGSAAEARLIEAEAALQADPNGGTWLAKLNALRTDGTFDTTATSPPDTLWHAGTGGVAGLAPLADPGTANGRVDLLFRERAFRLFLTGHRQGDLRRLIRQYGRGQHTLYPVGAYNVALPYGSDVTLPVPPEEFANPLYTGCASLGA